MVDGVSAGVSEVEDSVGARRTPQRRWNVGIADRKIVKKLVGAGFLPNGRSDVQVNGPHQVVSGDKQVSGAQRESLHDLAVNFEAGLFRIGRAQIAVYGGPALSKQ